MPHLVLVTAVKLLLRLMCTPGASWSSDRGDSPSREMNHTSDNLFDPEGDE